jgi:hypothetical protein
MSRTDIIHGSNRHTTLFHYTDGVGLRGILETGHLLPSLKRHNPRDVRYGEGQYLSDRVPGTLSSSQLSRCFLGQPFQARRFTHFIEIDMVGIDVLKGRDGVYVVLGREPLDLSGRLIRSGEN